MKTLKFILPALVCSIAALAVGTVPARADAFENADFAKSQKLKVDWKKTFSDGLFLADGTKVPLTKLTSKKFVVVYVSASWCGPCRVFTPKLVDLYKSDGNKGIFETVLLGADRSEAEVFKYAKDHEMPWFVAKYGSAGVKSLQNRLGVKYIPACYIFKKNGDLVASTNSFDEVKKVLGIK